MKGTPESSSQGAPTKSRKEDTHTSSEKEQKKASQAAAGRAWTPIKRAKVHRESSLDGASKASGSNHQEEVRVLWALNLENNLDLFSPLTIFRGQKNSQVKTSQFSSLLFGEVGLP